MPRLTRAALDDQSLPLRLPAYDRARVTPGIVHLGIGAFHRAHMAVYVDDLLCASPDWGIVGASLRRPDTRDALAPQDFLYTLAVRDASGTACRVVGSIIDVLDANTQRHRLLDLMAHPAIRIVSLTITERAIATIRRPASSTRTIRTSCTTSTIRTSRSAPRACSRRPSSGAASRALRPSP